MTTTYISKLRLRNFKSFGKISVFDFNPGFNCIIGANGSGKSNVLDSLCFVLGRLSTKSIRAENYSALIHRSKKITQSDNADVGIQLDNKSKVFPVDSNILDITRSVLKSGQTQYRINQKRATRNQVLDTLGASRVMPEGHNIILQGDVERFVSMSPIEKRKLIEEVAGIWVYENKKESALKELEKVAGRLRDVQIVMSEKSSYMNNLESDKNAAEKYRSYQNELEQARATEFRIKLNQLSERRKQITKRLDNIKNKNDRINQEVKAVDVKIKLFETKLRNIEKNIEQRGGEAQLELQRTIDQLKGDLDNGKSIIKSSQNEIKRINVRRQQLKNNLEELNKKVRVKDNEVRDLRKRKSEFEKRKQTIEKTVGISESDLKNLGETLEKKEELIDNLKSEHEKAKDSIQSQISELKIINLKIEQINEKLLEIAGKQKQVQSLKKDKDTYKKIIFDINKALTMDNKLSEEIQDLRYKLHEKEDSSARLRSTLNAAQDIIMRDKAISKILASKSKIKGVIGTVAELGRIDPEIKIALNVAAGSRMKNVVVENENNAIQCLQLLRESKAGVATFLPLNKISRYTTSSITKMVLGRNGVIGLATELISCDVKYKPIFQHIFRDTLIIENSSIAKSLGIGKFNMVTLQGDIFGRSGAITGGFRRESGFSFIEKNAGSKLDKLLAETDKISKNIKKKEKERRNLEQSIFKLRSTKADLEGRIGVIDNSGLDPSEIKNQKVHLLANRKKILDTLKRLEGIEKEIHQEINKKVIEKNYLKSKAKDLQFGKKKEELNELESQINLVDGKISIVESLLENSLQLEKKNIAKVLLGLAKEREEFEAQIKSEMKKVICSKEQLTKKEKEEKAFFGALKKLFGEKNIVSEKIKKYEEQYKLLRERMTGEDEERNALNISNAKIEAELSVIHRELEPIKDVKVLPHIKTISETRKRQSELRKRLDNMGNVNMRALEIFESAQKEFNKLKWRVNKLDTEKSSIEDVINRIETKKKDTFLTTFDKISNEFENTFKKVTSNMTAKLILENKQDPFSAGIKVEMQDRNKSKKSIFSLSGGEKTLTALSLIFAIQSVDPAPFYLLDEIDAALDKVNSEKVALLLKEYSKKSQIIAISHNEALIHAADNIYGIWKTKEGLSQINSMRL